MPTNWSCIRRWRYWRKSNFVEKKLKTESEKYNNIEWGKATEMVNKVAISMDEVMQSPAAYQND